MTPTLRGVSQLHISVRDIETSVQFYRDVLGLEHLFTVEGRPMAFFDVGGVRLYLGIPADERFRSQPVIYYGVDDVEAAWAEVTARGAAPLSSPRVVHTDGATELWAAFVTDPDGTPVGLMAERAAQRQPGQPSASSPPNATP